MEKPSKGVILFVIFGLFIPFINSIISLKEFSIIRMVTLAALIVLFYFLFRLRNWSRITLLIIEVLGLVFFCDSVIAPAVVIVYRRGMDGMKALTALFSYVGIIKLLFAISAGLYAIAFIYYFTRTKVKEQFR